MRLRVVAGALALMTGAVMAHGQVADEVSKRVIDYYRRKANVSTMASVTLADVTDAPIPGAKTGVLVIEVEGQTQTVPLVMSADGRYVAFAKLEDSSLSPFEAIAAKITTEKRPVRGAARAPVTIVEFSDFQCPYSAEVHPRVRDEVLGAYEGKVRLVHKHHPFAFHNWSGFAAVVSECVFVQSEPAFWKLYDYLFEHQKELSEATKDMDAKDTSALVKEKSLAALRDDRLDVGKFTKCYDDPATAERVRADLREGEEVGVSGTPVFFINGRKLVGAAPFDLFKAVIDDELARLEDRAGRPTQ